MHSSTKKDGYENSLIAPNVKRYRFRHSYIERLNLKRDAIVCKIHDEKSLFDNPAFAKKIFKGLWFTRS